MNVVDVYLLMRGIRPVVLAAFRPSCVPAVVAIRSELVAEDLQGGYIVQRYRIYAEAIG